MSQPKRYDCGMTEESLPSGIINRWPLMHSHPGGKYVLHSDYAALAAENERLKASVRHYVEQDALRKAGETIHQQRIESGSYNREKNETIKRLAAEVEHLKTRPTLANQYADYAALAAENERLRKAGDAMAELVESEVKHTWNRNSKLKAWETAKEGGANGCFVNHNKVAQYLPKPNTAKEGNRK